MKRLWTSTAAAVAALVMAMPGTAEAKWTGCYVGAQIGTSFAQSDVSVNGVGTILDGLSATGWQGGPVVGCDMQFSEKWVAGLFGTYEFGKANSDNVVLGNPLNYSIQNEWTLGGRIGYLLSPHTMVYGLVGYSQADVGDVNINGLSIDNMKGYALGAGLETALTEKVSLKLEYKYTQYADSDIGFKGIGTVAGMDTDAHAVRLGVNYHFNWSDPVPESYK